jgi:pantetheine-phosphate adenylyltransferase
MFDLTERVEMLNEVVASRHPRVTVDTFDGLLIDYAVSKGAQAVVRGIRAISDYEYELQMALMNRRLCPQVETVFLMSAEENSYISSRLVKEVFSLGGVIEGLVPDLVIERMKAKAGVEKGARVNS